MSLIQDILDVLLADAVGKTVLSTKAVPQVSPQSTNLSVLASYAQHNVADLTSVSEKAYDSVRNLYVDVKTAAVQALVALPIGSEKYLEVDRFFKFAAALIIREGSRMDLFGGKDPEDVVPEDVTEFEEEIVADYADLTADLESWSAESFLVMGQNGPLFSTLSTKSAIDPRPSITPGAFQVTNVLPRTRSVPAYQLGYLTPAVSRLPHPALPPTEMMTHFVHPNGSELAPSRFLRMDANSSFAPTSDSGKAVYDPASTGALWYEKVGRLRESAIDDALGKNDTKKEDTNDVEMNDATEAKVEGQEEEEEKGDRERKRKTSSLCLEMKMSTPPRICPWKTFSNGTLETSLTTTSSKPSKLAPSSSLSADSCSNCNNSRQTVWPHLTYLHQCRLRSDGLQ